MNTENHIADALQAGTVLNGQLAYTIVRCLGQGGFGITYLARGNMQIGNINHQLLFTIKEFYMKNVCMRNPDGGMQIAKGNEDNVEEHKRAFMKEAQRLNQLERHPGIVGVNEVFRQNNTVYYVMEYLGNESLCTYIQANGGKLKEDGAMSIFKRLAEALQHIHDKKITHLDVKPANVMMRQNEAGTLSPVLIDFGLAIHFGNSNAPTSENKTICCTDGYSPLEQYMGINTFSPEADIYALGATLLYMLTGANPPMANKMTEQYVDDTIGNSVSPQISKVIKKCMAKLPEQRYCSVTDLLLDLNPAEALTGGDTTRVIGAKDSKRKKRFKFSPMGLVNLKLAGLFLLSAAVVLAVLLLINNFQNTGNSMESYSETNDTTLVVVSDEVVQENDATQTKQEETKPQPIEEAAGQVQENASPEQPTFQESQRTELQEKPASEETPATPQTKKIDLGYATYEGEINNGKPHGRGKLTFTESHVIDVNDPQKNEAEAGETVEGKFYLGHLTRGKWTKNNGETQNIYIGK